MIFIKFEVFGSTLDEIREKAVVELRRVDPGSNASIVSMHIAPVLVGASGEISYWRAEVEARS